MAHDNLHLQVPQAVPMPPSLNNMQEMPPTDGKRHTRKAAALPHAKTTKEIKCFYNHRLAMAERWLWFGEAF